MMDRSEPRVEQRAPTLLEAKPTCSDLPSRLPRKRREDAPLHLALIAICGALLLAGCGERTENADTKKAATPAPAPETTWAMTRGGPTLAGAVAAPIPVDPVTAWTFTADGPVSAEAAIANGRVYVGTDKGVLHCLEAETGREVWRFAARDTIATAPAVGRERLFVAANDGRLYALRADSGAEVWQYAGEDKMSSGAILIPNPTGAGEWVLVNGYDGTTRVLDAADGRVVWTYKTDDYINGSPAVVDGRYLVFGGCDAQLHVVNLRDGTPVHKIPTSAQILSSIATYGAMAFGSNHGNEVVGFDVTGGKVAWTYQDRALPFFSSPAVTERLVLIGSRDKHLHAIDRRTGAGVWKFPTGGRVEGSPIVFADGVVFGSSDGRLYAASLDAGAELWRVELGESLLAAPAFGGRQIVIGGEKGTVFALRARAAP
jgi:outer membrane protein assembly factor BamB